MRSAIIRRLPSLGLAALILAQEGMAQGLGPGIANSTYAQAEVFKAIGYVHARSSANPSVSKGINVTSLFKGYLLFGYGEDSGRPGGGFAFVDVSDPRNPKQIFAKDVHDLRESHAYGFHRHGERDYFAAQSIYGIHIYDATDVRNPVLVKDVRIPGVSADDYSHGAWWLTWQAPWIWVSRGADGVTLIDASVPAEAKPVPVVVDGRNTASFPITKAGNFEIGPNFAVGNLLVVTTHRVGGDGISAIDISDPTSPRLLATARAGSCYSTFFNGGKVYCNDGSVSAWEVTPAAIRRTAASASAGSSGEYLHVQDGFVHMGTSDKYAKIRLSDMKILDNSYSLPGDAQEGFATPFGNLVLVADDHAVGSAFVVHQAEPDRAAPAVNFVSPADGAVNQKATSRIGVTFTDQVQVHTVDSATFIVRPVGGKPLKGRYSSQTNIVNFSPDAPLLPGTTYEVVVPKGGIKDYAGNPTAADFTSRFSTGGTVTGLGRRAGPGGDLSLRPERIAGGVAFLVDGLPGADGRFDLILHDSRGAVVRRMEATAGSRLAWDATDGSGRRAPAGLYLARVLSGSGSATARFVLE